MANLGERSYAVEHEGLNPAKAQLDQVSRWLNEDAHQDAFRGLNGLVPLVESGEIQLEDLRASHENVFNALVYTQYGSEGEWLLSEELRAPYGVSKRASETSHAVTEATAN